MAIITLGDDVWKNWGILTTINLAVIGWLIHRHGLYGLQEKWVASVANTVFVVLIHAGMHNAYDKLDSAANELAYHYLSSNKSFAEGGIIERYIKMSPRYCRSFPQIDECAAYSSHFSFAMLFIWLSWLVNMVLFWRESFWKGSRGATPGWRSALVENKQRCYKSFKLLFSLDFS